MKTVVLIPTYYRTEGLRRLLQSLRDTAPRIKSVVVAEPLDKKAGGVAKEFGAVFVESVAPQKSVYGWNLALTHALNFDAYVLGADDTYYAPGWYEESVKALKKIGGSGLVGFSGDEGRPCSEHYLMTRDFMIEHHGGVMAIPCYTGWYVDWEAVERAKRVGKFAFAKKAVVHHDWHGSATNNFAHEGLSLYREREAAGFPDNFDPILTELSV
jgi:GT2 family glycosyltransferase